MKLTKTQLRQIIREEIQKLNEKQTSIDVSWVNPDGFTRRKTIKASSKKQFNKKFSQLEKKLKNAGAFRSDKWHDTLQIAKWDLSHPWFQ